MSRLLRMFVGTALGIGLLGCGSGSHSATAVMPTKPVAPVAQAAAPQNETGSPTAEDEPPHLGIWLASILYEFQSLHQLQDASVRERLGLSESQAAVLVPLGEEARQHGESLRQLPREQMEQRLREEFLPLSRSYRQTLDETLTAEQREALWGIVVRQQRGAVALLLPRVPELLELSDEQIRGVEAVMLRSLKTVDPRTISPFNMVSLLRLAATARADAESVLTETQRQRWHQLLEP